MSNLKEISNPVAQPLAHLTSRVNGFHYPVEVRVESSEAVSDLLNMPGVEASCASSQPTILVQRRYFGDAIVAKTTFPPGQLAMLAGDAENAEKAEFRVIVCLNAAELRTEEMTTRLRRGDMALIDLAAGATILTDHPTSWLSLSISRSAIASRFGGASGRSSAVPVLPAVVFRRGAPLAALFRRCLLKLWRSDFVLLPIEGAEAAECQLDLLADAVSEAAARSADDQLWRLASLIAVSKAIYANIPNVDFDAADLAANLKVSPKMLCRLLGPLTTTHLIRHHRLLAARRIIRTGASRSLTIAEISHRCGFGSLSHFSTLYKAVFGLTPADDHAER